jgi:hypothetical protein
MMNQAPPSHYELCFRSLIHSGRGFAFPCDARGEVHLDGLRERARNNYFYARAMVGRELAPPTVGPARGHRDAEKTEPTGSVALTRSCRPVILKCSSTFIEVTLEEMASCADYARFGAALAVAPIPAQGQAHRPSSSAKRQPHG